MRERGGNKKAYGRRERERVRMKRRGSEKVKDLERKEQSEKGREKKRKKLKEREKRVKRGGDEKENDWKEETGKWKKNKII